MTKLPALLILILLFTCVPSNGQRQIVDSSSDSKPSWVGEPLLGRSFQHLFSSWVILSIHNYQTEDLS